MNDKRRLGTNETRSLKWGCNLKVPLRLVPVEGEKGRRKRKVVETGAEED